MARLPQVPRRGELLQAPRSTVSAETIATPYQTIANIAAGISGVIMDKAEADATVRGSNAVVRDQDGNPTVRFMPNWTQVGRNYNRAAMQGLLAAYGNDMRDSAQRIAMEANGNPDTFSTAWTTFAEQMLGRVPEEARGGVQQMLDDVGGAQYRGVMSTQYERDINRAQDNIVALRTRIRAELETLAYQGAGGTEEYARLSAEYRDLGLELARTYNIAPEAHRWAEDRFAADLVILTVRGDVARRFATSPAEARAYAQEILNNPDLPLTADERRRAMDAVMQQFTASTSEYRMAQQAYRDATDDLLTSLRDTSLPFDPAQVEQAIAQGLNVGDFTRVAEIERWARYRGRTAAFEALTPAQQVQQYGADYRAASGVANVVDRIIGVESSGNPNARNPSSSATGLGQFIDSTWMTMIERYRPELMEGRTRAEVLAMRTDPALSREMTTRYVEENAAALAARGLEPTDGNIYLAHFLGPAGAIAVLSADPSTPISQLVGAQAISANSSILAGRTAADVIAWAARKMGQPAPTVQIPPETLREERRILDQNLGVMMDQAETMIAAGFGIDGEQARVLVDFAMAVDNPATTARVSEIITQSMTTELVTGLTGTEAEAFLGQLASGVTGDDYLTAVMTSAANRVKDHQDQLRATNPYLLGVERGLYQATPIDFSTPATMEQSLATRQSQMALLSDQEGVPYRTLLQPEEASALEEAWAAADVDGRVQMARAFANAVPDGDTLRSTLGQLSGGRAHTLAVAGAIAGADPEAARGIIRGEAILAAEPARAPRENDTTTEQGYRTLSHQQLPPTIFGGDGMMEEARQGLIDSARLLYVAMAYDAGMPPNAPLDPRMWQRALDGVTGGTVTFNGQQIIAPVRGMTQQQFDRLIGGGGGQSFGWRIIGRIVPASAFINALTHGLVGGGAADNAPSAVSGALRGAQTASGVPITYEALMSPDVFLESVGDGRYAIRFGGRPGVYAVDANGAPFELDLGRAALVPYGMRLAEQMGVLPRRPPPAAAALTPVQGGLRQLNPMSREEFGLGQYRMPGGNAGEALPAPPPAVAEALDGIALTNLTMQQAALIAQDLGLGEHWGPQLAEILARYYGVSEDEVMRQLAANPGYRTGERF